MRWHDETNDDLEREPRITDALDIKERLVRLRLFLGERPDGVVRSVAKRNCDVGDDGNAHVWVRLEAEGQDGHDDEENWDNGANLWEIWKKYKYIL